MLVIDLNSIYHFGLTKSDPTLTAAQQISLTKWAFANLVVLIIANMFVKLAIGLFLLRIFTTSRTRSWVVYGILAFVVATSISAAIAVLCECRPIAKLFNPSIPGSCVSDTTRDAIPYFQSSKLPHALSGF